jgi:hypothetical protein
MRFFAVVVVSFARRHAAATMTTTLLSLTDSILTAHSAQLEEMKTHTCGDDDFSSGRFEQMLIRLQDFVEGYSLDPKNRRIGPLSAFTIDLRAYMPTTELGKLEVILLEWNSDVID